MSYIEAASRLRDTLDVLKLNYRREIAPPPKVERFCRVVFGDALYGEIAGSGWVSLPSMPWFCDDVEFYPLSELEKRQSGYRTQGIFHSVVKDWDTQRYVFGITYNNPLCLHRNGEVSIAGRGTGTWIFASLADSLPLFLEIFAKYLRWFAFDHGCEIAGEDFVVTDAVRAEIQERFLKKLSPQQADAFLKFVLP